MATEYQMQYGRVMVWSDNDAKAYNSVQLKWQ